MSEPTKSVSEQAKDVQGALWLPVTLLVYALFLTYDALRKASALAERLN